MTLAAILQQQHEQGRGIVHAPSSATVADAIAVLARERIGAIPVIDEDRVVGIMSERDVIHALQRGGAEVLGWTIAQVMTAPAITVDPSMSLLAGLSLMTKRRVRHLPVVADDRLVGFVSIGDLVKARIDRIEEEADAMRAYIAG